MFGTLINRIIEIEQTATDVWRKFCVGQIPVPTRPVITGLGIQLRHLSSEYEYEAIFDLSSVPPYELRLRDRRIDQSVTGYGRRLRFTEAHEFGHFFLHLDCHEFHRESGTTVVEAGESGNFVLVEREIEANCFAAAFLMPQHAFRAELRPLQIEGGSIGTWRETLAKKYNVSLSAVEMRIARLRDDCVLSGYAWASNGEIISMIPSLELELVDPALAKEAWRCNPQVRTHILRKLSPALLRDLSSQIRKLPDNDIAAVKIERDDVPLSEFLSDVGKDISGSAFIIGCKKGGRKFYFEMELAHVH